MKWAVNSGGIILQHPVLWPFVSAPFPTKALSPHDKPSDETKHLLLCDFFPSLWQKSHGGFFNLTSEGLEDSS